MTEICNELTLFLFTVAMLYHLLPSPNIFKSVFWTLVLWLIYSNFIADSAELFHFEVSPWKTTCLNDAGKRCPGCCLPGFNGQAINFEYTGDEERMNASLGGCNSNYPPLGKNRVSDYSMI